MRPTQRAAEVNTGGGSMGSWYLQLARALAPAPAGIYTLSGSSWSQWTLGVGEAN